MPWVGRQCVVFACPGHTQFCFLICLVLLLQMMLQFADLVLVPNMHNNIHAVYFMIQILDLISMNNLK